MVSVEPPPDQMGPVESPASYPQSEGIPKAVVALTTVVPFNDLPALERAFKSHPDDIAAVIVEPAMMNVGIVLPDAGYLAGIKEIAHRNGCLLYTSLRSPCSSTAAREATCGMSTATSTWISTTASASWWSATPTR